MTRQVCIVTFLIALCVGLLLIIWSIYPAHPPIQHDNFKPIVQIIHVQVNMAIPIRVGDTTLLILVPMEYSKVTYQNKLTGETVTRIENGREVHNSNH
jgi:hypothetical protein